jgi:hypothetical protein
VREFCGTFHGWGGELFFGWGRSTNASDADLRDLWNGARAEVDFRVGTPFHAAQMGNLFKQLAGERNWTLVSPAHVQLLRPLHGLGYIDGLGAYRHGADGWAGNDSGWTDAFARLAPKLTVTTRPGDMLWIPPWWMHETRADQPGFTFGVSTRGFGWTGRSWRLWPLLRFLPLVNPTSAGIDGLLLDSVHTIWYGLARVLELASTGEPGDLSAPIRGRKGEIQHNLAQFKPVRWG